MIRIENHHNDRDGQHRSAFVRTEESHSLLPDKIKKEKEKCSLWLVQRKGALWVDTAPCQGTECEGRKGWIYSFLSFIEVQFYQTQRCRLRITEKQDRKKLGPHTMALPCPLGLLNIRLLGHREKR